MLVLFYVGVALVLVAMGTSFGRRHPVIGRLGLACAVVASVGGALTYMVFDR